MLLAMGALGLAGCSSPGVAGGPALGGQAGTATPSPNAATVFEDAVNAQKTQTKDVEFSMNTNLKERDITITGDVTGKQTSSPRRLDVVITNFKTGSMQFSGEIITDAATHSTYIKFTGTTPFPGIPVGTWVKTFGGFFFFNPLMTDPAQFSDLSQFKGATLKGSETLDGISVWHYQVTRTFRETTTKIDIYIRQDNKQLYEIVSNETGTSSGSVTFKITGVNTGATISLPPASQVTNQYPSQG
jgi:hypothetical protein